MDSEGNYPKYIVDVQAAEPSWTVGQALPAGWQVVQDTLPPETTKYQVLEEGTPQVVEGVLSRVWSVRDMTAEEIEAVDAPDTLKTKLLGLGLTETEANFLLYRRS